MYVISIIDVYVVILSSIIDAVLFIRSRLTVFPLFDGIFLIGNDPASGAAVEIIDHPFIARFRIGRGIFLVLHVGPCLGVFELGYLAELSDQFVVGIDVSDILQFLVIGVGPLGQKVGDEMSRQSVDRMKFGTDVEGEEPAPMEAPDFQLIIRELAMEDVSGRFSDMAGMMLALEGQGGSRRSGVDFKDLTAGLVQCIQRSRMLGG